MAEPVAYADTAWLATLQAEVTALWAWVVSIAAFIWGVLVVMYEVFVAWATPIIVWLQGIASFLWDVYNNWVKPVLTTLKDLYDTWVKPAIEFLQTTVAWLKGIVLLVQGKLEDLINYVYNKVAKDVEELRANIIKVSDTLKDVASIFSKDLADKIQATEDKTLRLLDSYTRDLRDWAISTLHEATDPLIRKTNEISVLLNGFISQVTDRFKPIETLIALTFEKPQTLKRETLFTTSQRWGMDLWRDLFSGQVSQMEVVPYSEREIFNLPDELERQLDYMILEDKGPWADVSKRIDEEIEEIVTGKAVSTKTEIKVTLPTKDRVTQILGIVKKRK